MQQFPEHNSLNKTQSYNRTKHWYLVEKSLNKKHFILTPLDGEGSLGITDHLIPIFLSLAPRTVPSTPVIQYIFMEVAR